MVKKSHSSSSAKISPEGAVPASLSRRRTRIRKARATPPPVGSSLEDGEVLSSPEASPQREA
eukprot:3669849-Karenia_brevis.AAC.1